MSGFLTTDGADYIMSIWSSIEVPVESYYIALVTQPIGSAESGDELAEIVSGDYYRAAIMAGPENWSVAYGSLTNLTQIALPVPVSEDWTGIVGWALCDADSGGRVLWAGDVDTFDIVIGEETYLPAGSLSLSFDLGTWRETT